MSTPRGGVRSRLTGLAALLTLVVLVLGVPAALLTVGGNPLTAGLPELQDLLRPDDGSLFLRVLVIVGWLAWASFTFSVLLEAATVLRGRPAPPLPALHLQQRAAAGLVGAVAVLFTVAAPAMASPASAAVPVTAPAVTTQTQPSEISSPPAGIDAQTGQQPAAAAQDTAPARPQLRQHTVTPGQSLWSIAERELGDGARFAEIAQLNYGHRQPDGRALDRDHWIQPGWTLQLPADPIATDTAQQPAHNRVVERGDTLAKIADDEYGDPSRFPDIATASHGITQPGGQHLTDPDVIDVGWTLHIPAANAAAAGSTPVAPPTAPTPGHPNEHADQAPARPAPPAPEAPQASTPAASPAASSPAVPPPDPAATPGQAAPGQLAPNATAAPSTAAPDAHADSDENQGVPVRTAAGVGALLAAGVLGLLASRRSAQQRRRRPGHKLPLPTGQSAAVEQDLRSVAAPLDVETVDLALRSLAAHCAAAQQPLPVVRAARLTDAQFELYLAQPAVLPEPWTGTADASVWTLPADADDLLDPADAADVPAPYPSLVTVGQDIEDGHVLLDLEHLGALGISGAADDTRELLAAIAVGLATSRWADDLQVTLVGAYPELEDVLQTGRIRYLPAVGHVLDELSARAELDRAVLSEQGAPDLHHARATGSAPDVWTPEIVLLAGQISQRQRQQLEQLVDQLPRVAIAAVTSGEPLGEWVIRLEGRHAVLEPIGLQISPQRLDEDTYGRTLDVLATADEDDDEPAVLDSPEPTLGDLPTTPAAPLHDLELVPLVQSPAASGQYAGSVRVHGGHTAMSAATATAGVVVSSVRSDLTTTPTTTPGEEADDAGRVDTQEPEALETSATSADVVTIDSDERPAGAPAAAFAADEPSGDGEATPLVAATQDDQSAEKPPEQAVEPLAEELGGEPASVHALPLKAPRVLVLGPVELADTNGPLPQPSHAKRYIELAAFLALHPDSDAKTIRAAYFNDGKRHADQAVHQAISRLRRWLGADEFMPKNPPGGRYRLGDAVTSDWQDWHKLLPDGPCTASSEALEQALALVRQRPFHGTHEDADKRVNKGYAWAEHSTQLMVCAIVDAAHELARRRLMEGRWRTVMEATAKGMLVEHGVQRLMRARILAARASDDSEVEQRETARLLDIVEELGDDLEPETTQLLKQLRDPVAARVEHLATQAL